MDLKWVLLLTALLVGYLCLGAGMFMLVEQENEDDTKKKIKEAFEQFLDNNTCITEENMKAFLESLLGYPSGFVSNYVAQEDNSTVLPTWDFGGSFTFAVTIVTTIGYGHIFPSTFLGQVLCIIYALIGIPFTLIVLGGIGEQLSICSNKLTKMNLRPDDPGMNKWINMGATVVLGLMVMFVVPSIVFSTIEDWDWFTAVYYCFTTLSTIGFGDYVAGSYPVLDSEHQQNMYRICVYVWILVGLAYLSLVITQISKVIAARAERLKQEALKRVNLQRLNTVTQGLSSGMANAMASTKTNGKSGKKSKDNSDKLYEKKDAEAVMKGSIEFGEESNGISLVRMKPLEVV